MKYLMTWLVLTGWTQWAQAGGTTCTSVASGDWSNSSTWNCTTVSGIPDADTTVTVNNTHTVLLDVDATVGLVFVFAGGDLDVAASGSGLTLTVNSPGSSLNEASVDLFGDLTINGAGDFIFGAMDGAFNLTVNVAGDTAFNGLLGNTTPLSILLVDTAGTTTVSQSITTNASINFLNPVLLAADLSLTGSDVVFLGEVDADPLALGSNLSITVSGLADFNATVGGNNPPNSLVVSGATSLSNGMGQVTTIGQQQYQGGLTITADTTLTSGSSLLRIDGSSGPHALVLNNPGTTWLGGTIGATPHTSITTDASGQTRFSGAVSVNVNGSTATTFNDNIALGASGNAVINQTGTGDVVFNGAINSSSGSPHRLTVNDVSGRTVFNNTVSIGQLTTNDGAGADVTVLNAPTINTSSGGADNGRMTFNDPVEVLQDVIISEGGNGRIWLIGGLDQGSGASSSHVTINSDNEVILGPVGLTTAPDSLTTDATGSTRLTGDVTVDNPMNFNDAVTLNTDVMVTAETINFNGDVSLQGFDLTVFAFSASIDGVISGTGDLISDVVTLFGVSGENTYTGQTIVNSGLLDLADAASNNNISVSSLIQLNIGNLRAHTMTGVFQLANGQTLTGFGNVLGTLQTASGSVLMPSPGGATMDIDALQMFTGSTHVVTINGSTAPTDYSQTAVSAINLDGDVTGGASLALQVNVPLTDTDEFLLIDNTGPGPVSGTYNGISEGGLVDVGSGLAMTISYQGGDGNDVVLSGLCQPNITVTDAGDSGAGTLRQAMADVCSGGVIDFAQDLTVILSTEINTDKTLTITSGGFDVTISGGNSTRLLVIDSAAAVTINQVNLSNGSSVTDAAAVFNDGTLSLFSSQVNNHTATGNGGAIVNTSNGNLNINSSTFFSNQGDRGGAIYNEGMLQIQNSTFTLNGTGGTLEGGAIHNRGTLQSTNNTFANNGVSNSNGAAVFTWNGDHELINTLIADNLSPIGCFIDLGNSTENNANSLIESGNCDAELTVDPQLQALANNGGQTMTMALALTSPAVDAGSDALCPLTDQRGVDRPQLEACDIGAYESEYLPIIYVDRDNTTRSGACIPGACWANAYEYLADALAVAGPTSQVWVADGVYYPDLGSGVVNDDPQASFTLAEGVFMYGGFNGTETDLEQRDFNINLTILSGDIDLNDENSDGNFIAETTNDVLGDNAYHVIEVSGNGVVVDGFTVTAGKAFEFPDDAQGGGLHCLSGASTGHVFANNIWIAHFALDDGGAVFACGGQFENSSLIENRSQGQGGAIFSQESLDLVGVNFVNNFADFGGGAVYASAMNIEQNVFEGNRTPAFGGAMVANDVLLIQNSLFNGNDAIQTGGAILLKGHSELVNVTMTGNKAGFLGGAIANGISTPGDELRVKNSILWNNEDGFGVGSISAGIDVASVATIAHTIFQGSGGSTNWNSAAGIDGGNNIDLDPEFMADADLNAIPITPANAHLTPGSVAIGTGDNAAVTTPLDLDNNPRIDGGVVDMGAYEYGDLIFEDGFE